MLNINQATFAFNIEVMVVRNIRIEITPRFLDLHFAQNTRFVKLVERVVNRGLANAQPGGAGFAVQGLGGNMAVALTKKQMRQSHARARGPQARRLQLSDNGRLPFIIPTTVAHRSLPFLFDIVFMRKSFC